MSASVRRYAAYGRCLASDLPFPELEESADVAPHWEFSTAPELPAMEAPSEIGADLLYADVSARLFAHNTGHRIRVDDTGDFDISDGGRVIRWVAREPAWPDFVRAHLLGRVLATTMYLDGWLPLHASAVETRAGVIAFLAPKGYGKSTLALALAGAGAHLVTDDTLPIDPARSPIAWPGVHAIRAHAEAVEALGLALPDARTPEGKHVISTIPYARRTHRPRPLAAIYLIDPVTPGNVAVARSEMPPLIAAIGVVAHVKIGRMLGAAAAAAMLERAARLAQGTPVYQLHTPRELSLLPEMASLILDWHGGVPA